MGRMTEPAGAGSGRLWSLWDIMRLFPQIELLDCIQELDDIADTCFRIAIIDQDQGEILADELWAAYQRVLRETEQVATVGAFMMAFESTQIIQSKLDTKRKQNVSTVRADVTHLVGLLRRDVDECKFLKIPEDRTGDIDNPELFGPIVAKAFPHAMEDLREAGNCRAAMCHTAAVFHFMRAVEWALRAFGAHLGFRQLRSVKKSGVVKLTPITHLEWEKILDQLQVKVDKRIERMRPGKTKQASQEFYYPALQEIRAMRDAWRNHVMHSRRLFDGDEAQSVRSHVERLFVHLAKRVSEA